MSTFNRIRRYRWYLLGRYKIKKQIRRNSAKGKLKIVLGAGPTVYDGWILTDIPHFDILKSDDWNHFLGNHQADNLLIEHVLEHLTQDQAAYVLSLSYKYLKPGACLRIAVPDGYHPDPAYIKLIAPPFHGHQSVWNIDTMKGLLSANGFKIDALEYYTRERIFSGKDFDITNGTIIRSKMKGFKSESHPNYSSLIIDAYK